MTREQILAMAAAQAEDNLRRFAGCVAATLRWEGGYVDHPQDPGGCTNRGITRATLERWRRAPTTCDDVRDLTEQEARKIYRAHYWNAVQGDALPDGIDLVVFDFAVNSGRRRAVQFLQRQLGVEEDGAIGPVTLAAVHAVNASSAFILQFQDARLDFLRGLDGWGAFGVGWENRVYDIRTRALRMAGPG